MRFLSCAGELNHHGKFMCDSMYFLLGKNFRRITTQKVNFERLNLGYSQNAVTEYNIEQLNAPKKEVEKTVAWCDVVDFGTAPEIYLEEAVKQNKIVFIRIERLFKEGFWKIIVPWVLLRYYKKYIRYRNNKNVYYLCVSAYAAKDLARIGVKGSRVLQWAYCPEFIEASEKEFDKHNKRLEVLWCGRMIGWKHPETAVKIAAHLKSIGCDFHMNIIGDGEKRTDIIKLIDKLKLEAYIDVLGAVESEKIRTYMKEADVFLATSDQNEGWGVVINEAMNSGCAVFANYEMGAVPVLIKDGKNGFYIYADREKDAAVQIFELSKDSNRLCDVKKSAYETIKNHYSPDVYAQRFTEMVSKIMSGEQFKYEHLGAIAKIN